MFPVASLTVWHHLSSLVIFAFAGSSATSAIDYTTQSSVKHWEDGGQRGLSSAFCRSRAKCETEANAASATFSRNCRCDRFCTFYDDCCEDFLPSEEASVLTHLPRGLATCQRMHDIETGQLIDVYKISRCPKKFVDQYIRELCETDASPSTSDLFYELPVTGNDSLVLYRNIYCAACAGERHPIFWLAKLRCPAEGNLNRTSDLKQFIRSGCPADFAPVREWEGFPGLPRRCKTHIGRCDKEWRNETVRRRCRQTTNYVYVGNRVFRNKHCAECNYVNETYLRCDDVRLTPETAVTGDVFFEETAPYVVTLDFNRGIATVTETRTGSGYVAERRVNFPKCQPAGSVYDPFSDSCRQVTCPPEMEFTAGKCLPKFASTEQEENSPNDRRMSSDNEMRTSADYDNDEPNDNGNYNNLYENSTEAINITFGQLVSLTSVEANTLATTDLASFQPMSVRFVLFQLDSIQRLLSIFGNLFCLLALVVYVVLYYIFPAMRNDFANRYVVCLAVCLIVGHFLFLFVILPNDDFPGSEACFCLSIVVQYAYMTSFFWLSVMSIDVFGRIQSTPDQQHPADRSRGQCTRFALFSLYAWVVPGLAMAGSTVIAVLRLDGWDQLYDGPTKGCYVLGLSQLILFIVPIGLVVATNFAMYAIIFIRLCLEPWQDQKDSDCLRQASKDRKRFLVCVQLTVVMTTTWTVALLAYFTRLSVLWYVFIGFDALQGLTLCLAFVWKIKVWHVFNGRVYTVTKRGSQHQSPDGTSEAFITALPDANDSRPNSTILRETSI